MFDYDAHTDLYADEWQALYDELLAITEDAPIPLGSEGLGKRDGFGQVEGLMF